MKILFICIWLSMTGSSNIVYIENEFYFDGLNSEGRTPIISRLEICSKEEDVFKFTPRDTISIDGIYIKTIPDCVYKYNLKTKELTKCEIEPIIKKTKRMEEHIDEKIIGHKLK